MRILLLCGNAPNHIALAHKIHANFNVAGVVIESRKHAPDYWAFRSIIAKISDLIYFKSINRAWTDLMAKYKTAYPSLPDAQILNVESINAPEVLAFAREIDAELVVVSGTSIIRSAFFDLKPSKGIINLHTGLSPYVRGGPNCSNWCIANNDHHLIGNTVMWLDEGIDSGNIISSAPVQFSGSESLLEIHIAVMEAAHDLYLKCIDALDQNYDRCPSIRQSDIDVGNLYLTKMWDFSAKKRLLKNMQKGRFKNSIVSEDYTSKQGQLRYVHLPNS